MTATSEPIRVAMVHYSDYHVDSRIQRQAGALAERGDTVELFCLSAPGEIPVGDGRIRIHAVHPDKAGGGATAYVRGYGGFLVRALRRLTTVDARSPFDVVEVHNMPDALVFTALGPKLRGTPVILNVHDTFPELFATKFNRPAGHPVVRLLRAEEFVSAACTDHVITVTAEAAELLNRRRVGVGRTTVVMNTPDETLFGPARPARDVPAHGPLRALYHGGLAPRFGVELLIRAMATADPRVDRLSLRVCGTGTEHAHLAALGAELAPGRVDVEPSPVPLARIPAELERAQIGVVPTLRDDFTEHLLPVKLLEYIHMGLPAIAPRLPVIERYFGDDEVRMFEPGSQDALADALAEVCSEPVAARERATRASRRLAEFGWASQRARYLGLVDRLAARRIQKRMTKVPAFADRSSGVGLL